VVATQFGYHPMEINASDERTATTLTARVLDAVQVCVCLWCGVVCCVVVQGGVVWCGVLSGAVVCGVWCGAVLSGVVRFGCAGVVWCGAAICLSGGICTKIGPCSYYETYE
jgi:hypothetical protein